MIINSGRNFLCSLAFICVVFASSAHAQSISFSSSFNLATGSSIGIAGTDSALLSFNQFDPGLGTLTGVMIDLGPSPTPTRFSVSNTVSATGGFPSFSVTSPSLSIFRVSLDGIPVFERPFTLNAGCSAVVPLFSTGSCTDTNSTPLLVFSDTENVSPADFSTFIGNGTVDLFVEAIAASLSPATSGSVQSVSASTNITWSGPIVIEYQYVPVPAAVWLFSSGLIGMIGIARRKNA